MGLNLRPGDLLVLTRVKAPDVGMVLGPFTKERLQWGYHILEWEYFDALERGPSWWCFWSGTQTVEYVTSVQINRGEVSILESA